MAIQANATLTFSDYAVTDEGIGFHFVCTAPGPGEPSDYYVAMTDAELAATANAAALRTALTAKLGRKLRASGIASRLDGLIGQNLTV
jgi:hypothetical protein